MVVCFVFWRGWTCQGTLLTRWCRSWGTALLWRLMFFLFVCVWKSKTLYMWCWISCTCCCFSEGCATWAFRFMVQRGFNSAVLNISGDFSCLCCHLACQKKDADFHLQRNFGLCINVRKHNSSKIVKAVNENANERKWPTMAEWAA